MKQGKSYSREYARWNGMIQRCTNPKRDSYKYYGALGIKVCDRWMSFDNFIKDMGKMPNTLYTIDRINPNGDYEPENCRWVTQSYQEHNKKVRAICGYKGVTKRGSKWQAAINRDGKRYYLGVFDTPLIAHQAYERKARELYPY